MSAAHFHLILNHLPILGVPFGIALLASGVLRKTEELKRAALVTFALAALFTIPVFYTGEPAEETIEHLPGVSESLIHDHEELAEISMGLMVLLGISSLGTLIVFRRREIPGSAQAAVLIVALVGAGSLALTGAAGGEIRHSEIRQVSQSRATETSAGGVVDKGTTQGREDEHDDD